MESNIHLIGILLVVLGAFVIFLKNLFVKFHQKIYTNPWYKRYWWEGWRPLYKDTQTLKWKLKWSRIVVVYGPIPPKYQLEILAFLLILAGAVFQII